MTETAKKTTTRKAAPEPSLRDELKTFATVLVTSMQVNRGRPYAAAKEWAQHVVEDIYGTSGK